MKLIFIVVFSMLLVGCFGPAKFDASSEATIQQTTKKIIAALPEEKREGFTEALMYFSIGGEGGFELMLGSALAGKSNEKTNEAMLLLNLTNIDGLTGEQIIAKYLNSVEQDRIKNEKEKAERLIKIEQDRVKYEREKAERAKVNDLKKQAAKLLESNNFKEALEKYQAMSEISSGVEDAEIEIKNATKAMEEFSEKMNYIDKIEITEFVAKRIDTYREKNLPAVRISLKNNGDRSLDEVKVTVYFQNKDGNTIYEKSYHPVLVSNYFSLGDNAPLKPGYVKEQETNKYYVLETALNEWQEGKAIAKIVDIKFSN